MTGLAVGCSHTVGIGVTPKECYVQLLAAHYNIRMENHAVPGGNADQCIRAVAWRLRNSRPSFVVAQWPNPIRRTFWHNDRANDETLHNASVVFRRVLAASEENFMQPWLQNIAIADTLCKLADVPVVHVLLEDLAPEYVEILNKQDIQLHRDQKQPGQTWLFDSQGSDGQHHSARCHAQWAERLIGLIDELTTR